MSIYQVVGAIAGAVVGFFTESPQAGFATYAAISGVGAYLDQPTRYGPRIEDLRQQLSSYGNPIPFEWGTNRHAGTVIWPRILEANEHSQSESAKGGPEQVTYTYTMSFAVLICEGPIAGVRRIWANKKLIYDASTDNTGAVRDPKISGLRFYLGTETQEVDPLIEATDGDSPAYLGYAYAVFEDYDVTEMNARLPQFEFEVITDGIEGNLDAVPLGACGNELAIDPNTGYIWSVEGVPNTQVNIFITDPLTGALINEINYVPSTTSSSMGSDITYNPTTGEFWVINENGTQILKIDAATYVVEELTGTIPSSYTGIIQYSPANLNIIVGNTNVNDALYFLNPVNGSYYGTLAMTGSIFGVNQIMTIANGYEAILLYQTIKVINANGSVSSVVNSYPNVDIGSDAFMAADNERERLIILNESSTTLIELDLGTATYTNHTITIPGDIPPTASTSFHRILWHSQNDKYYVTAHQAGLDWTLYTINPNTYTVEDVQLYSGPTNVGNLLEYPDHPEFLIYTDSGTDTIYKLPLYSLLDPNAVLLSQIVTDICVRAGLTEDDIDVSELTDEVIGYVIGRQMTARAALEQLMQAFYFDVVESEDKIKFVKRGSSTSTTIPMVDRAASQLGSELVPSIELTRAFDTELPIQCDVEYPDIDADHLVGNQYDRRITKDTKNRINLQFAIVMQAPKAKEIARVNLYAAWQKQTFKWCTSRKYAYLEPTDIVDIPDDTATYRARITNRRDQPNGLIEWEGIIDSQEVYEQSGDDAIPASYESQSVFDPSITRLVMMDIPMLRDEDDNAGYYTAMGGSA